MTTYLSNKAQPGVGPKFNHTGSIPVYATYAFTSAPALNDLVQMMTIPAGATIVSVILDSDKLDTSTGMTLDVGDGTVANRYLAASNLPQAGGAAVANVAAAYGFQYTVNTPLYVKIHAAATAFQAGSVRLMVEYTMDP